MWPFSPRRRLSQVTSGHDALTPIGALWGSLPPWQSGAGGDISRIQGLWVPSWSQREGNSSLPLGESQFQVWGRAPTLTLRLRECLRLRPAFLVCTMSREKEGWSRGSLWFLQLTGGSEVPQSESWCQLCGGALLLCHYLEHTPQPHVTCCPQQSGGY